MDFIHLLMDEGALRMKQMDKQHLNHHISPEFAQTHIIDVVYPLASGNPRKTSKLSYLFPLAGREVRL
ncbi:hypothetical protein HQN87_22435 [Paenibacillus tritici]|uniref:Uncharacterized protein n=1 Tax=Paenibacillus tritici TaxID=1873425 RepID=A0ABX2DTR5_9BACL|nr:hypothetical protein [Paenibacillus tritici]NQX48086.1 hypothetical protein [Paenibacillus tritici]QUL56967.1 hypothetical protein KDC22_11090 [Paenibacillus tritici]